VGKSWAGAVRVSRRVAAKSLGSMMGLRRGVCVGSEVTIPHDSLPWVNMLEIAEQREIAINLYNKKEHGSMKSAERWVSPSRRCTLIFPSRRIPWLKMK
jgi:hypothetical protein